jgi:hypothetical protein
MMTKMMTKKMKKKNGQQVTRITAPLTIFMEPSLTSIPAKELFKQADNLYTKSTGAKSNLIYSESWAREAFQVLIFLGMARLEKGVYYKITK